MSRRPILSAAALILLLACHGEVQAPERPATVPADALWVGSSEGGAFLRLRASGLGEFQGEVYDDVTGKSLASGRFVLKGAPLDEVKVQDASGWDGHRILLRSGGWLEPAR